MAYVGQIAPQTQILLTQSNPTDLRELDIPVLWEPLLQISILIIRSTFPLKVPGTYFCIYLIRKNYQSTQLQQVCYL
jgi:hypothetical protein